MTKTPFAAFHTDCTSYPDTLLDRVMLKVLSYVEGVKDPAEVVNALIR